MTRLSTPTLRRLRRSLGRLAVRGLNALGVLLAVVFACVLAALVCVDLPPVRSFVVARVNQLLAHAVRGRIVLEDYAHVDLAGAKGIRANIFDPEGNRVIHVDGLDARVGWVTLLFHVLLEDEGPLQVRVEQPEIRYAEVSLSVNRQGTLNLARSFEPLTYSQIETSPTRATEVSIDDIEIEHAWVHGDLDAGPPIDADVAVLGGRVRVDESRLAINVQSATLKARLPRIREISAEISGNGSLDLVTSRPSLDLRGSLHGQGVTWQARVQLEDRALLATLQGDVADAERLARFIHPLRLGPNATVLARVQGTLPHAYVAVDVRPSDTAALQVTGLADLEKSRLDADIVARDIHLTELFSPAPSSSIDLTGSTQLSWASEQLHAEYTLRSNGSVLDGHEIPAVRADGSVVAGDAGDGELRGSMNILEPGAPTQIDFNLSFARPSKLELHAHTVLRDPPRLAALLETQQLSGQVDTWGQLDLGTETLNAQTRVDLRRFSRTDVQGEELRAQVHLSGPIATPTISTQLTARRLHVVGRPLESVHLRANGTPRDLKIEGAVYDTPDRRLDLQTTLALERRPRLRHTQIRVSDAETQVGMSVDEVSVGDAGVRIRDLRIDGLGRARLSATIDQGLREVQLETQHFHFARLAKMWAPDLPLRSGTASIVANYDATGPTPRAQVRGRIERLGVGDVPSVGLTMNLMASEDTVNGSLHAAFNDDGGEATLVVNELHGDTLSQWPPDPARLRGGVWTRGDLELYCLTPLLKGLALPVRSAAGRVNFSATAIANPTPGELPRMWATLRTKGLQLSLPHESDEAKPSNEAAQPPVLSLEGIDVRASARLDPSDDSLEIGATAFDRHGALATMRGEARVRASDLRAQQLEPRLWRSTKFRFWMPPRPVETWPGLFKPKAIRGVASLEAHLRNTMRGPQLVASGALRNFSAAEEEAPPLDVHFTLGSNLQGGELWLNAYGNGSSRRTAAQLHTSWTGSILDVTPGNQASQLGVTVAGDLCLDDFPIGSFATTSEHGIRGSASGCIKLRQLGQDAKLRAQLSVRGLQVGEVTFPNTSTTLQAAEGTFLASAHFEQVEGASDARVEGQMHWGARLIPEVFAPVQARVTARAFHLAALLPLTNGALSELGGELDANVNARLDANETQLEGQAVVRNGVLEVPAIGQRFRDISARMSLRAGKFELDEFSARGISGKLEARGEARLAGLRLESAKAHVHIAEQDKLPLTLQGIPVGEGWGKLDVQLDSWQMGQPSDISVQLAEFHIELPDTPPHGVQSLEPARHVHIGVNLPDAGFVTIPVQPIEENAENTSPPTRVHVQLGPSVSVAKGNAGEVQLSGSLEVELANDGTRINGELQAKSGQLDVSGKTFEIERATLTFNPKRPAEDPTVFAVARWDSPSDFAVYARYVGTVSQGKLTMYSEPPLTQDQILSLILFGTPEGSFGGTTGGNSAATALGVVGATATRGLNRALDDITDLDVSTRVDTSTGNARPELVVQLTPRLAAHVTRALGAAAPGEPPDRTFLILDYHLQGGWSLSSSLGDRGASALDLIWRHFY